MVGITESGAYLEFKHNPFPFLPILSSLGNHLLFYTSLWPQSWRRFLSGSLSFGSLRLASTDVRVNSVVRFNCFTDPKDVETRLSGMRKIGEMLRSRSMGDFIGQGLGREL